MKNSERRRVRGVTVQTFNLSLFRVLEQVFLRRRGRVVLLRASDAEERAIGFEKKPEREPVSPNASAH